MPIKFRCSYCRQFLGISRSQAGGVVDCPSCGRSIRVPQLDGAVLPVSEPEINADDAQLARALDELARLVDAPVQKFVTLTAAHGELDENEAENQIPQPLLEPIPIEVPLPPTPVVVQPAVNATIATGSESVASEMQLLTELAALSAGTAAIGSFDASQAANRRSSPGWRITRSRVGKTLIVVAIFLAGMFTEKFVRILDNSLRKSTPADQIANPDVLATELIGRITFKTKEGVSQPDRGARILVFPEQRLGDVRLPTTGFRPADEVANQMIADSTLKAAGGGAATVDDSGNYRMAIDSGAYRVLVLSHFQPRGDAENDPAMIQFLSAFFENPDQLLGRVAYKFSPLRIKGSDDIWDHSF